MGALIGRQDRRGRLLWSLPKGHIEAGESAEQAAVREVAEETGIAGRIIGRLGTIDFWFMADGRRVHKTVHHFLLRAEGGELSDADVEVSEVAWVPLDELAGTAGVRGRAGAGRPAPRSCSTVSDRARAGCAHRRRGRRGGSCWPGCRSRRRPGASAAAPGDPPVSVTLQSLEPRDVRARLELRVTALLRNTSADATGPLTVRLRRGAVLDTRGELQAADTTRRRPGPPPAQPQTCAAGWRPGSRAG